MLRVMETQPQPAVVTDLMCQAIMLLGSQQKLADAVGRSQNAVFHAKSTGRVTAEMALAIDRATDGAVSRHQLRPDLYGPPADIVEEAA